VENRSDTADLFRSEFREEQVWESGRESDLFGLIDSAPDQSEWDLVIILACKLPAERHFELMKALPQRKTLRLRAAS
jgi:hypothetical protein